MGKCILAHWCYSSNFGDALNPYLLSKLSGKKVKYCNSFTPNYKEEVLHLFRAIFHFHKYNLRLLLLPEKSKPVVLAVGSILSRSRMNHLVWGGGYMDASEKGKGGKLYGGLFLQTSWLSKAILVVQCMVIPLYYFRWFIHRLLKKSIRWVLFLISVIFPRYYMTFRIRRLFILEEKLRR